MRYYTIQENSILIAENEEALTRFYDDVFELPDDYEIGKYIIDEEAIEPEDEEGEIEYRKILILNPDWEEIVARKEREDRIGEIKEELNEIDLKSIRPIRAQEQDRLEELENRAIQLRLELHELMQEEDESIESSEQESEEE